MESCYFMASLLLISVLQVRWAGLKSFKGAQLAARPQFAHNWTTHWHGCAVENLSEGCKHSGFNPPEVTVEEVKHVSKAD